MRMDIKLANGTNIFLQYEQFKVASAKDKYNLTVGGFQGTTTDPMAYHNGMYLKTVIMINGARIVQKIIGILHQMEDGGIMLVHICNLIHFTTTNLQLNSTQSNTLFLL